MACGHTANTMTTDRLDRSATFLERFAKCAELFKNSKIQDSYEGTKAFVFHNLCGEVFWSSLKLRKILPLGQMLKSRRLSPVSHQGTRGSIRNSRTDNRCRSEEDSTDSGFGEEKDLMQSRADGVGIPVRKQRAPGV